MPKETLQRLNTFISAGNANSEKTRLEMRDECLKKYRKSEGVEAAEALALALRLMQPDPQQEQIQYAWNDPRLFRLTLERTDLSGLRFMLALHPKTFNVNQMLYDVFPQGTFPSLVILDPAIDDELIFPNYSLNYIPSANQAIEAWTFYSKPKTLKNPRVLIEILEKLLDATSYPTPMEGIQATCMIYERLQNSEHRFLNYAADLMENVTKYFEANIKKSVQSGECDWTMNCLENIKAATPLLPTATKMFLEYRNYASTDSTMLNALLFTLLQKTMFHDREILFFKLCEDASLRLGYAQLNELFCLAEKTMPCLYADTLFFLSRDKAEKEGIPLNHADPDKILLRAQAYIKSLNDYREFEKLGRALDFLSTTASRAMCSLLQQKRKTVSAFMN